MHSDKAAAVARAGNTVVLGPKKMDCPVRPAMTRVTANGIPLPCKGAEGAGDGALGPADLVQNRVVMMAGQNAELHRQ